MRAFVSAAAGVVALTLASPAAAVIFIGTGAGTVMPDENLLFNNNPPNGLTIAGITNTTATLVNVSAGETLVGNGGQARVEAADGLIGTAFTFNGLADQTIGLDFADASASFDQVEFRIFVGRGTATSLTLNFFDTDGEQFTQTFAIPSNGFFFADAMDGQRIDYFSFAANGTFEDVRQIRIGGIGGPGQAIIPEPTAWALMILGFGGVGGMMRRRRAEITEFV